MTAWLAGVGGPGWEGTPYGPSRPNPTTVVRTPRPTRVPHRGSSEKTRRDGGSRGVEDGLPSPGEPVSTRTGCGYSGSCATRTTTVTTCPRWSSRCRWCTRSDRRGFAPGRRCGGSRRHRTSWTWPSRSTCPPLPSRWGPRIRKGRSLTSTRTCPHRFRRLVRSDVFL